MANKFSLYPRIQVITKAWLLTIVTHIQTRSISTRFHWALKQ